MKTRNTFKCFMLVIAFFTMNVISAQSEAETKVKEMAKQMFVDMVNKDYESILDMSHPKLFEVASREQVITMFKSMLEGNNDFTIELPKTIPAYKVSDVFEKKEEAATFAFVSYDLTMKMTFNNQSFDEEAKKGMKTTMGYQGMDVEFISNNSMNVSMKDQITILIKDKSTQQKWAMVNYDAKSPLMGMFLSPQVLEAAKKYKEEMDAKEKK